MLFSKIKTWIYNIIHINRLKEKSASLQSTLEKIEERQKQTEEEIIDIKNNQFERDYNRLLANNEWLRRLNIQLSITPTIWGDERRLDISDKAAVFTCLFNTNSGRITIGDFTFAGSGVSILAGSHDPELRGFVRRDAAYKEGHDIEIGKGVWLGSNATILGPCIIEDDAVVAAGAVVLPGTHIGKGELYGGVPAKRLKVIETIDNLEKDTQKLMEVITREDGLLFYSGWTEKKVIGRKEGVYIGHWMTDDCAVIYSSNEVIELFLISDLKDGETATIYLEDGSSMSLHVEYDVTPAIIKTKSFEKPYKITVKTESKIFVSGDKVQ